MLKSYDNRISALNVVFEIAISEYIELAQSIIANNDYQRKRVRSSTSVYNLLKTDLQKGCIIPPIVLAISKDKVDFDTDIDLIEYLIANKSHVLILDGLQRTFTLRDLVNELKANSDPVLSEVLQRKIRIEVYLGLNRLGILYRMLTLNSGQTPMSSRHQIEIIYSDFVKNGIHGISLVKEVDDTSVDTPNQYKFSDVIDGFTSYMERDYLSIDRVDILDNIKSLERFSNENSPDVFENFITSYNSISTFFRTYIPQWRFDAEENQFKGRAFAVNIDKIFSKSQALTGFGAAVGKLIDNKEISNLQEISTIVQSISSNNLKVGLDELIITLDKVRNDAKKIGNDQRLFFHFLFRKLLSRNSDSYLNFYDSVLEAYTSYERETK